MDYSYKILDRMKNEELNVKKILAVNNAASNARISFTFNSSFRSSNI